MPTQIGETIINFQIITLIYQWRVLRTSGWRSVAVSITTISNLIGYDTNYMLPKAD